MAHFIFAECRHSIVACLCSHFRSIDPVAALHASQAGHKTTMTCKKSQAGHKTTMTCKKIIYTLAKNILYAKLTYCHHSIKNYEHLDLRITKMWVQQK